MLSLVFYHYPLLDGLKQSHPAYATFTGLCRKLELPSHHLLLPAAWSSYYLCIDSRGQEGQSSQYCRLAPRAHISQFHFAVWQWNGFSHFRNCFWAHFSLSLLKAARVKAFQLFLSEGKSAPVSARLETRVHCNSIPSCEAVHRAQHGPSPSKRCGDIGMLSGDTALNIRLVPGTGTNTH